ncbi:MAG TPA: NAD(P)H-hydrate dehydratase, partial [Propylenella sp.]|nr:NAD(P)H-hydrate dehydratase [Propylenella sp.]
GDAARAATLYDGPVEPAHAETGFDTGLIVDALFGAGLTRPLDANAGSLVEAANSSGTPILAVDLPSGIDGRTGEIRGAAIRAHRTVTFFRLKPGHVLLPGRLHCGETELVDIGIPESALEEIRPSTFHNQPALWRSQLQSPAAGDHKYSRGHVVVVSGPASATGAARLAAAGALRIGAGAVTVASPPSAVLVNAVHLTAIMVRVFESVAEFTALIEDRRSNSVVIGPGNGVGVATRANVEAALASDAALVLDADALTSFAETADSLFERIRPRTRPVVLTPHEGEFGRLFRAAGAKIDRARAAAAESGAVVVLKGADTIVAAPDGRAAVNSNAPPYLATAGSGDVLAGIIAGLLAQGMPAFEAAAAGVWMHGAAGSAYGRGLTAEDLPNMLAGVLQRLDAEDTPAR